MMVKRHAYADILHERSSDVDNGWLARPRWASWKSATDPGQLSHVEGIRRLSFRHHTGANYGPSDLSGATLLEEVADELIAKKAAANRTSVRARFAAEATLRACNDCKLRLLQCICSMRDTHIRHRRQAPSLSVGIFRFPAFCIC